MNLDFINDIENKYQRRGVVLLIALGYIVFFCLMIVFETARDILKFTYTFWKRYLPEVYKLFYEGVIQPLKGKW